MIVPIAAKPQQTFKCSKQSAAGRRTLTMETKSQQPAATSNTRLLSSVFQTHFSPQSAATAASSPAAQSPARVRRLVSECVSLDVGGRRTKSCGSAIIPHVAAAAAAAPDASSVFSQSSIGCEKWQRGRTREEVRRKPG